MYKPGVYMGAEVARNANAPHKPKRTGWPVPRTETQTQINPFLPFKNASWPKIASQAAFRTAQLAGYLQMEASDESVRNF